MTRRSDDERPKRSARFGDESGFTLIELLMTMVVAIIVLGGGTYGLAAAFRQSNEVSARTSSTNQSEVGLQELTRDLRYATICPTYGGVNILGAGGNQINGVLVSAGPQLQMCDPIPGAHASQPPPLALVTWRCNTASTVEACNRSWVPLYCPASGGTTTPATASTCSSGAPTAGTSSGSTSVSGVTSMTFSGVVSGVSLPSLLTDSACQAATGYESYGLIAPAASTSASGANCALSWVGIQAQLVALSDPGSPSDSANSGLDQKTSPIQIQTGAALRNYGT